jgi:hypothetical protein
MTQINKAMETKPENATRSKALQLLKKKKPGTEVVVAALKNEDVEHKYGHEFKEFKDKLEKKHGAGNVKFQGDGDVSDAYHKTTGKHLGFIDGTHIEIKEEVETLDEISDEKKQQYLDKAIPTRLQQFLGRAPTTKQQLDKRRASIQKVSKELTGKTHYTEEVESVDELAIDTVKSYKAKVATNPAPSKTTSDILHKAIRRFAGKERAEDRIHSDEMKKMRDRLGLKTEETLDESLTYQQKLHHLRVDPINATPRDLLGKIGVFGEKSNLGNDEEYKKAMADAHEYGKTKFAGKYEVTHVGHRQDKIRAGSVAKVRRSMNEETLVEGEPGTENHAKLALKFRKQVDKMLADGHAGDAVARVYALQQHHEKKAKELNEETLAERADREDDEGYARTKDEDDEWNKKLGHTPPVPKPTPARKKEPIDIWKKKPGVDEEVEQVEEDDDAQKHMSNAMDNIHPDKRVAARKLYNSARAKGLPHAASLNIMHDRFGGTNEEVVEEGSVLRTAAYGADPDDIAGLLAAGEEGIRNLVKKGVDKTKAHVAKKMADAKKPTRDEYEPISYKPSASRMRESASEEMSIKQIQREHLEQTGQLLSLAEVKYMVENAKGGVGAIAQHAGVDGEAPEGTGKVKKMMGNKTDIKAIAKIITNGVKPKEESN